MKKLICLALFVLFILSSSYGFYLHGSGATGGGGATLEVDSVCEIKATDSSWDTVHDTPIGTTGDTETGVEQFGGGSYAIYRTHLSFNTGAELPDSITVTLAQLRIYVTTTTTANSKDIDACDSSYDQSCVSGSYNDLTVDSPTIYGSSAISGMSTSAYNTITLNASAYAYIQTQAAANAAINIALRGEGDADDSSADLSAGERDVIELDHSVGSGNPAELYIEYN